MTHIFEADFEQDFIKAAGRKVIKSVKCVRCHDFSLKSEFNSVSTAVQLLAGKCVKEKWLYGPAMTIKNRSVIYPCSRYRCSIPCPCLFCCHRLPRCHVPGSQACVCIDCINHFEDHSHFHAAFHIDCKSCIQLLENIPQLKFSF